MNKSLSLFLLLVCLVSAQAANKYVRKGATGTGTGADWTNAYTELNQVTTAGLAGFTIYVAAGTYTTNFISFSNIDNWSLKRATIADHGTDVGWNASFDGQVTASNTGKFMSLSGCDNVTIDGGGTKEPWLFRVVGQQASNGKFEIWTGNNVTVRYIEMDGNGCEPNQANGPEDGFRLGDNTNLILEHNWIHDYWYCDYGNSSGHADAIQMPSVNSCIIRYNKFGDSGMLLFMGDCTWQSSFWANNVHVHHNIFIQQGGTLGTNEANYRIQDNKGINQTASSYWIVENNTYYAASGFGGETIYENSDCPANTTRRIIRNNIFVNGGFNLASGNGQASFNQCFGGSTIGSNVLTSNPLFINQSAFNFRLQAGSPAADSGTNTTFGFSGPDAQANQFDYDGNAIGTQRSRGAFEPAAPADPPPSISSATISAAGTQVAIVFSEVVQVGAGGDDGWTLQMSGGDIAIPIQTPTGTGNTRTYVFSSVRTIGQGETGTIAYAQPGNGIEDSTLQDLPNASTAPVTNNSTIPAVAAPSFSPVEGSYFGTQSITMTSSTPGATIRYTTNGTDPTGSSTQYTGAIPTSISTTYRAKAFASGFIDSSITSAAYEIGTWSTVSSAWKSFPVTSQTGTFTWTFRASASQAATDGVIGLSSVLPDGFNDIGPIIQFNIDNTIKARNGANYEALNSFTYVPGTTYEIVCIVNIANRTYSITAAQIGGSPVTIGTNYAWRSDSPVAPELDNFGMSALAGSVTVSQMSFGIVTGTIPTLTGATIGSNGTTLTLGFSVPVVYGTGGSGGWTISASGGAATLTPTANPITFTVSRPIATGETGTISYTQPGNGVEAVTGGGDLATLTSFAFNNQSTIDLTAPIPNPMTFSAIPIATSSSSATMTASVATDVSTPPVQYYFDETSGNAGGTDSGWTTSRTYINNGLSPGIQYTYRVMARDSAAVPNQTTPSSSVNVTTPIVAGGKVITPAGSTGAGFFNP